MKKRNSPCNASLFLFRDCTMCPKSWSHHRTPTMRWHTLESAREQVSSSHASLHLEGNTERVDPVHTMPILRRGITKRKKKYPSPIILALQGRGRSPDRSADTNHNLLQVSLSLYPLFVDQLQMCAIYWLSNYMTKAEYQLTNPISKLIIIGERKLIKSQAN